MAAVMQRKMADAAFDFCLLLVEVPTSSAVRVFFSKVEVCLLEVLLPSASLFPAIGFRLVESIWALFVPSVFWIYNVYLQSGKIAWGESFLQE